MELANDNVEDDGKSLVTAAKSKVWVFPYWPVRYMILGKITTRGRKFCRSNFDGKWYWQLCYQILIALCDLPEWIDTLTSVNCVITDSDNGMPPIRCQAITWTNDESFLIGTLGTKFNEILIKMYCIHFLSTKCVLRYRLQNVGHFVQASPLAFFLQNKWRKKKCILLLLVLLFIAIVAIIIGVTIDQTNKKSWSPPHAVTDTGVMKRACAPFTDIDWL